MVELCGQQELLTPLNIKTNDEELKTNLMLYESHYSLITKLQPLLKSNSQIQPFRRRFPTKFFFCWFRGSPGDILEP